MAVDELRPDEAIGRDQAPRWLPGVLRWPRAPDARVRVLVWAVWLATFVSALVLVVANGRDVPVHEDWTVAPAMTGHQDNFLGWLWSQNNEHRVPVPRLVYLGLLKLWPDFRVGMVFNVVLLAAIAAAFIIFLHRVRGRSRWTDAFFPIVFLNLGNWENMGWGWQLQFVVATALVCGLLMGIASRASSRPGGPWWSVGAWWGSPSPERPPCPSPSFCPSPSYPGSVRLAGTPAPFSSPRSA